MDFKDFVPELGNSSTLSGGASHYGTLVNKKTDYRIVIEERSSFEAIMTWNFLATFMDPNQPLPDLPEIEACRQNDPITKAYDEKTGRDPFYW